MGLFVSYTVYERGQHPVGRPIARPRTPPALRPNKKSQKEPHMFSLADVIQPPLCTSDLPGIGGKIKTIPEDFEVEEIPAYEPSGQGDFLYLWIEKRDMSAEYFTRQIARRLDMPVGEVGTAGLTRQMVPQLEGDGIKVLRVGRHSNKVRAGHLHDLRSIDNPAFPKDEVNRRASMPPWRFSMLYDGLFSRPAGLIDGGAAAVF